MKTRIITLESHDDLISVRDQMSWAKTPRILLVWPKYEKVTLRQVDLKVLQRHASSLGAQLGLVTRARRVRADAEELLIPVFESAGEAQRVSWPKPRRRRIAWHPPAKDLREQRSQLPASEADWRAYPAARVSGFLIGVFAVLTLVAVFIPRARITLNPIAKTQSIQLPVMASPSIESVFITGSIPAREKRVVVDGKQTVVVTGASIIPQSKARGTVVFQNITKQSVSVPAGTIVQNVNGIRFVTTDDGDVDAGVGKSIGLPIEATQGGVAGNLPEETINSIEGRLGLLLTVTNPEPTTGGRELPSVQASDADRKRAKDLLMATLEERAREIFAEELASGNLLFNKTIAVSQTLLEEYDPPAGAAGTQLTLTMQVEFSAYYADASDVTQLASLALNASLPPGFSAASEALTVKAVTTPVVNENGSAKWTVRVERKIIQQINTAQVAQMLQGIGARDVGSQLDAILPLASDPEIRMTPSWWPWMPIVPFRISVVTE
jgi:hypothetical protein